MKIGIRAMALALCVVMVSAVSAHGESVSSHGVKWPTRGYRGFAELGGGWLDWSSFGITTTHGFQLNPKVYIGLGVGVMAGIGSSGITDVDGYEIGDFNDNTKVPVFANCRVDFKKKKVSPFVSGRLGGVFGPNDFGGFYFSPVGGLRVNRVSFSAGFDLMLATVSTWDHYDFWDWAVRNPTQYRVGDYSGYDPKHYLRLANFVFRVAVEFGNRRE